MRYLLILMAVLTAAACASNKPVDPRIAQTAANTTREQSNFDKFVSYQGPRQALRNDNGYALLRSWTSDTKRDQHQLYVRVIHDDWAKNFTSASWPGGERVELKAIDVGSTCQGTAKDCPTYEDVGLWLKEGELKRAARNGGLRLRLNARRGENVMVDLPDWYLKGYLNKVD